jgi:hypothetical protein
VQKVTVSTVRWCKLSQQPPPNVVVAGGSVWWEWMCSSKDKVDAGERLVGGAYKMV